ncbi:hypothetical protein BUALT_Bualt13G0019400 [Buddleja alternifolia]|uniref:Cystatin domain-containing protein n=1 Tax=Buddleja alternifolia TaxID=168488 RepID=A0AAV6WJL2_9LAMI|nr:hypothetical protein BUALT_Bualt13G0019400 [Buddleja alternifolia]
MASKSFSLLLVLLSIFVASSSYEAATIGDDYHPIIDLKNATIVSIGKLAVKEHNDQAKTTLEFVSILEGEYKKVVLGTKYKFVIAAKNGAPKPENYEAVVVRGGSIGLVLISFKQLLGL